MIGRFIADDDGWGQAILALAADASHEAATARLLEHLATPVPGAAPSKTWRRTCDELLTDADCRRLVKRMVTAIADAPTVVGMVENQFGQTGPVVVGFRNADVARGAIWAAGQPAAGWVPDALAAAFARA